MLASDLAAQRLKTIQRALALFAESLGGFAHRRLFIASILSRILGLADNIAEGRQEELDLVVDFVLERHGPEAPTVSAQIHLNRKGRRASALRGLER